jgi:uncharacterized protein (DUF4415 family)
MILSYSLPMSNIPLFRPKKDQPKKVKTSIALDEDVLDWFRSTGRGFQTRINQALRWYIEQAERELAKKKGEDREGQ